MPSARATLALLLLALPAAARAQHRHHRHRDHVRVACPVPMDDPGLVLARVGDVVLTACDLALARAHRARAGMDDDPRATLRALVDDALLAEEARAHPPPLSPDAARPLAEAVVRAEALAALADRRPDDADIDRWIRAHPELAVRDERVHLMQLVFATEAEARRAIEALRAGTSTFEELLPASLDPLASRDGGDLGLLTREGAPGVHPGVVEAGLAMTAPGVAPAPVEGSVTARPPRAHGQRRRPRPRTTSVWHVVVLLERVPEERVADDVLRRRAALRILRDRYAAAREEARARLAEQLRPQVSAAVQPAGLLRVRVAP